MSPNAGVPFRVGEHTKATGFSELPKLPQQQNQTFGTSCFRLAQESLKCAFFLTDQQFPFRVKGDIQGGRRDLDKKKMFYSL